MTHELPFETTLRNGDAVRIREVGPDDRDLLVQGFEQLSPQSRFFRFLAAHKDLSRSELDTFTRQNTSEHFAIGAALIESEPERPLAIARYVRTPASNTSAEIALTVIDSYQQQGLGSLLMTALAQAAQDRGVTEFQALVHEDNIGMQSLLRNFGASRAGAGDEDEWVMPLPAVRQRASDSEAARATGSRG